MNNNELANLIVGAYFFVIFMIFFGQYIYDKFFAKVFCPNCSSRLCFAGYTPGEPKWIDDNKYVCKKCGSKYLISGGIFRKVS